ncbi:MAG: fructose-bisphosphatase class I, partial [Caulobacter sp. 35-67-4]
MTTLKTLADHLAAEQTAHEAVKDVVAVIAQACVQISRVVASGAISGSLGAAGQVNVQ